MGHPHTPSKNKVTKRGQQARLPQNTTKTSRHHTELHLEVRGRQWLGLGVSWGCREQAATLPARCSFKSSHFLAGAESFWLLAQHLH